MASITGKDGYVTKQVSGVDTLIVGIREWSIDYNTDIMDATVFAEAGVTHKTKIASLSASEGTFVGIIQSTDVDVDGGTAYNIMLNADSNRSYYGSAYIKQVGASIVIDGEATATYSFEFTGKVYVLSEDVVVDGDFTAATSAAWDVSDADVTYDTTGDQLDFTGDATVAPSSNDVITSAKKYWTQIKIEGESGTSTCQLTVGGKALTSRTANGTYTEVMTSDTSAVTFSVAVTTDDALSISEIIIRQILN